MNKAIQYREDGKFYGLVNVPEEPYHNKGVSPSGIDYEIVDELNDEYESKLKACIAAGKEIINPEVLKWANMNSAAFFLRVSNSLKPEDIFSCPENIEFEEVQKPVYNIPDIQKDNSASYHIETVIRLKLKEKVKPGESQDELWNEVAITFMNKYSNPAIEENKSKFTITRNKNGNE